MHRQQFAYRDGGQGKNIVGVGFANILSTTLRFDKDIGVNQESHAALASSVQRGFLYIQISLRFLRIA